MSYKFLSHAIYCLNRFSHTSSYTLIKYITTRNQCHFSVLLHQSILLLYVYNVSLYICNIPWCINNMLIQPFIYFHTKICIITFILFQWLYNDNEIIIRVISGRMAQLLRRETSCFEPPRSGFTYVQLWIWMFRSFTMK